MINTPTGDRASRYKASHLTNIAAARSEYPA